MNQRIKVIAHETMTLQEVAHLSLRICNMHVPRLAYKVFVLSGTVPVPGSSFPSTEGGGVSANAVLPFSTDRLLSIGGVVILEVGTVKSWLMLSNELLQSVIRAAPLG
jgi:hypothetical protein